MITWWQLNEQDKTSGYQSWQIQFTIWQITIIQFLQIQIQIHLWLIKFRTKEEESRDEGSCSRNVNCMLCLQTSIVRRQYLDAKEKQWNNSSRACSLAKVEQPANQTWAGQFFQINVRISIWPYFGKWFEQCFWNIIWMQIMWLWRWFDGPFEWEARMFWSTCKALHIKGATRGQQWWLFEEKVDVWIISSSEYMPESDVQVEKMLHIWQHTLRQTANVCNIIKLSEDSSLSFPNWQPEDSARIIGRRMSQMKRRINEDKRKEDSRGCSSFKKEIGDLLSHVCFKCGSVGPILEEELFQITISPNSLLHTENCMLNKDTA